MSDMPKEIWAISKVWCGNPKSKVSYTISCIDADDSPRGIKYIRADLVPQWQPIETAPKAGSEVFMVTGMTEQPCVVTRSAKNWRETGYPFAAYHTGVVFAEDKFTHWMPLPTPPAQENNDDV